MRVVLYSGYHFLKINNLYTFFSYMCMLRYACGDQRTIYETHLPPCGSWRLNSDGRLGCKHLYLPSHLAGLDTYSFNCHYGGRLNSLGKTQPLELSKKQSWAKKPNYFASNWDNNLEFIVTSLWKFLYVGKRWLFVSIFSSNVAWMRMVPRGSYMLCS